MDRFAFTVVLFALFCSAGAAQSKWGLGKPVPGGCPATESVDIPPGTGRFSVDFCKPTSSTAAYDYIARDERDTTDTQGHPMHQIEFAQKGDHWLLVAGYSFYKNGSRISYSGSKENIGKFYDLPDLDILEFHEVSHWDCYDTGEVQGLAKLKSTGQHVYFRYLIGGDADEYAFVKTDCDHGACDPDDVGYEMLKHVHFTALAACPR